MNRSVWRTLRDYGAHDDPLVAAGNLVALVIAANQPLYPLYLHWTLGDGALIACLTLLSTPFFLAVPAVARRHPCGARVLLVLAGIGNTVFSAKIFGAASGVELFLMPCILLAAALFRRSERLVMLGMVGLVLFVFAGLHGRYGVPWHGFTPAQYGHFLTLNAFSVGTLTAFIGITLADVLHAAETRP